MKFFVLKIRALKICELQSCMRKCALLICKVFAKSWALLHPRRLHDLALFCTIVPTWYYALLCTLAYSCALLRTHHKVRSVPITFIKTVIGRILLWCIVIWAWIIRTWFIESGRGSYCVFVAYLELRWISLEILYVQRTGLAMARCNSYFRICFAKTNGCAAVHDTVKQFLTEKFYLV